MIVIAVLIPVALGLFTVWVIPLVQSFFGRHQSGGAVKPHDDNHL